MESARSNTHVEQTYILAAMIQLFPVGLDVLCAVKQRRNNRDCVYENNAQGCRIHKTEDTHRDLGKGNAEGLQCVATMRFIAVRLVKVL